MRPTKTEVRLARCAEQMLRGQRSEVGGQRSGKHAESLKAENGFVTRHGLAAVLKVSVRTVDEMVAAKEITPVRIRGLVRFYLPDVVRELTAAALRKAEILKAESRSGKSTVGTWSFNSGLLHSLS